MTEPDQVARSLEPPVGRRTDLIKALAYCVDSLAGQALMDSAGAIRNALAVDARVWDHLSKDTVEILYNGMGLEAPNNAYPTASPPNEARKEQGE